jgi:16S rRNA processing protein RimM
MYYLHELVGCMVETVGGDRLGEVARVDGGAGSSQLVVGRGTEEVLIPLAEPICIDVNVVAKRIVVAPPEGLLELNEVGHRHDLSANGRGGSRGRGRQSRD